MNEREIIYIFNYILKLSCLKDVVVQKIEPMGMKKNILKLICCAFIFNLGSKF